MSHNAPPRWVESLLRLLLPRRHRDTVSGDLLEEYREVIIPARGYVGANLWYLRQTVSFVDDLLLGVTLGVAFGIWNLIATHRNPLADDTPLALLIFYGPMFTAWGYAGFAATQRTGRIVEAIEAGATVALVTFVIFWIANLVRVNIFLEAISYRSDWQNLVLRFQQSGFDSFRAFVNYEYLTGAPVKFFVPCVIGAVMGFIGGGMFAIAIRKEAPQITLP